MTNEKLTKADLVKAYEIFQQVRMPDRAVLNQHTLDLLVENGMGGDEVKLIHDGTHSKYVFATRIVD